MVNGGLFQLVYTSELTMPMDERDAELASIESSAQRNNPAAGVTGALLVVGRRVIQVLEGDESAVMRLLEKIDQDPRHTKVEKIYGQMADVRAFPEWSMCVGAVDADSPGAEEVRIILDAYGRAYHFDIQEYVDIARRQLGI